MLALQGLVNIQMALSYCWKPLRSIPDLIPACIKILKDEWPHCKAEILPQLAKQELNVAPCSYGLVEYSDGTSKEGTLVGHVRLIPVTNRQRAVYGESICIDKEKRGQGLGLFATMEIENLAAKSGYAEYFGSIHKYHKAFYLNRFFSVYTKPLHTLGANLLHSNTPVDGGPTFVSWHGNTLYPGWEWVYEGGAIATEADLALGDSDLLIVKYFQ